MIGSFENFLEHETSSFVLFALGIIIVLQIIIFLTIWYFYRKSKHHQEKSQSELLQRIRAQYEDQFYENLASIDRVGAELERLRSSFSGSGRVSKLSAQPRPPRLSELSQQRARAWRPSELRNIEGTAELEPIVLFGLLGSIASIISLLQDNKKLLDPRDVLAHFRKRQADPKSPEFKIGKIAKDADILANARMMIGVQATDSIFLDRIRERCLNPYYNAIADHGLDDVDLEEIRGKTADCVCTNISMARKDKGGSFPSDDFKELWKQFGCS